MNLTDQINRHRYLYLTDISEPEDNVLRLVIEEARASGEPEEVRIGEVLLSGVSPVVSDEHCNAYEVVFSSYVAYCVRNESFTLQGKSEEFVGRLFCVYSKSHFLDHVRVATFASDDFPGKLNHYGINCLNHIADVVSVEEPAINILRRGRRADETDHNQLAS